MSIDIIFGSNSSGTAVVAELIGEALRVAGQRVTITHARDAKPEIVGRASLTLLGSCTWERFEGKTKLEGQLQYHMYRLAAAIRRQKLPGKKFALFALGDSSYSQFCHAADELERLVADIEGQRLVSTLRIDGWFFNQPGNRQLVERWTKQLITAIATQP